MRKRWSTGWGQAAIALAALAGTSCVEGPSALVIEQAQLPQIKDGVCEISAERTNFTLSSGIYDLALDRSYAYEVYPLLANRLTPLAVENGIEPNTMSVTAIRVKIEPPPGITVAWNDACPEEFDFAPAAVLLPPGAERTTIVQAMRPCHADLLRQLFIEQKLSASMSEHVRFRAILRARARHGSSDVVSAPFEFPIRVCYGCLQTGFGSDFAGFDFPKVPPCAMVGAHTYTGNYPCNVGQDRGPLLCCARDADGKDIECPARARVVSEKK